MSNYMKKMRDKLPEMGSFTHKYLKDILTIVAIIAACISSWRGFFINGLGMSVLFLFFGLVLGIVFSTQINTYFHKFYAMTSTHNQILQIGIECLKIVLAFILAFLYFGGIGLLAASAYHYFSHQAKGRNGHDRAA